MNAMRLTWPRESAIAEIRAFALLMVNASQVMLSAKLLLQQLTNTYIGWWKTISKEQSRCNNHKNSLSMTGNTPMPHFFQNTSGNKRTQATISNDASSSCNLCLSEKLYILSTHTASLRNKRSELITKFCHETKFFRYHHRKRHSNRP